MNALLTEDFESRTIETGHLQGSGYGWAIVEVPNRDHLVAVWLINEDPGEPLAELRRFNTQGSGPHNALTLFLTQIETAIADGRGPALLKAAVQP